MGIKGQVAWNRGLRGVQGVNSGSFKKGEHRSVGTEFKKGSKVNLGRFWSKESREKARKAKLGKKISEATRKKMSEVHLRIAKRGARSHNWRGGLSRKNYPSVFNNLLRERVRSRDNFVCQICLRTEKQELDETGFVLCVNHIDFNKNNCEESNLNTLCRSCNLKINFKREYWTNYFKNKCKNLT